MHYSIPAIIVGLLFISYPKFMFKLSAIAAVLVVCRMYYTGQ